MKKSTPVEEARAFFKPHMPGYSAAIAQHAPELLVDLHHAVRAGHVRLSQLQRLGAHYVGLPEPHRAQYAAVLKAADAIAARDGATKAVEHLTQHRENLKRAAEALVRPTSVDLTKLPRRSAARLAASKTSFGKSLATWLAAAGIAAGASYGSGYLVGKYLIDKPPASASVKLKNTKPPVRFTMPPTNISGRTTGLAETSTRKGKPPASEKD